jgi:hypothetical protein
VRSVRCSLALSHADSIPFAVSDNNGGLIWRDLRQPKESAKRWGIDRYKGPFVRSSRPPTRC